MKLSESVSIPDHLWREIQHYDPALRIHWDGPAQRVQVTRHGHRLWAFEPYESNFYLLRYTIAQQDIQRRGGAGAVEADIDRMAEDATRKSRAKHSDDREMAARESWDYANRVRTLPEKYAHTAPEGGMSINSGW